MVVVDSYCMGHFGMAIRTSYSDSKPAAVVPDECSASDPAFVARECAALLVVVSVVLVALAVVSIEVVAAAPPFPAPFGAVVLLLVAARAVSVVPRRLLVDRYHQRGHHQHSAPAA